VLEDLLPKATREPPAQCPGHRRALEGRRLIARGGAKWNPGFQPQPRNRALKGRCNESNTRTTPAGFGDVWVDSSWGSASLHPRLLSIAPSALPEKPSPWGMTDSRFGQQTLEGRGSWTGILISARARARARRTGISPVSNGLSTILTGSLHPPGFRQDQIFGGSSPEAKRQLRCPDSAHR
jgi:hypothetical protein